MQQQKSLQQQNKTLQNKIKILQKQLDTLTEQSKNFHYQKSMEKSHINDSTQTQDKNNESMIEYSPIHTCESLQSQGMSIDMLQGRSPLQGVTQIEWGKTLFEGTIQAQSNKQTKFLNQQDLKQHQSQQQQITHFVQQKSPLPDILSCHHTISQLSKQSYQQPQPLHNNALLQLSQHTPQPSQPIPLKNLKKSIQLPTTSTKQILNNLTRNFYNSAIKQKSHCQQCLNRMHQLHEMEFLKNKYHREYIALRAQVDRIKQGSGENINNNSNTNQNDTYTPRSSLNLIQFYGQPLSSYNDKNYYYVNNNNNNNNNDQRSQKSSFSFQNIQNTLLSQRFALEMQQCMKLADKLLLVERKFIQLSQGDCRLLVEFEGRVERLKYHLGLETQPKFLEELFAELDNQQLMIKNIHQKYRKLIQKLCKSYKEKAKRIKEQFYEVNSVMIVQLKDLSLMRMKNSKLQAEIQVLKGQLGEYKDLRSTNIGHQAMVGVNNMAEVKLSKDLANSYQILNPSNNNKQRDQHISFTPQQNLLTQTQLQKSSISSCCQAKSQKQLQKLQSKIKTLERQNKLLQKTIKQMKNQISGMKKKALSDFNQFINGVICNKEERKRNVGVGTDVVDGEEGSNDLDGTILIKRLSTVNQQSQKLQKQRPSNKHSQNQQKRMSQKSQQHRSSSHRSSQLQQPLVQTLSAIIYDIFSFTSLQTDQSASIFQPETQQQLIDMLQHIKHFTSKFDLYQKEKQREISQLRKNFLHLLKFFIQHYKIPEEELLQQIHKSTYNNQPLVSYIKNYYLRRSAVDDFSMTQGGNKTRRAKSTTNSSNNKNQKQNLHQRDSSEYTFGQKSQSCKDSQVQP